MSSLDDSQRNRAIDAQGMYRLIEELPQQLRQARKTGSSLALAAPDEIRNLAVAGLGGSAIGGDLVQNAAGNLIRVPYQVVRDYRLPAYVGKNSAVIVCSYSGNTQETLEALNEAIAANAFVVCITSGGKVAELAASQGIPVVSMPSGYPPRAALGFSSVLLISVLGALGLIPDPGPLIDESISVLDEQQSLLGTAVPESRNQAKQIARSFHNRLGCIYASNSVLAGAAVRWRGQLEENAKNLAFHHLIPEMNHNELVGWQYPGALLREIAVLFLRDREDHPQVQQRFELSRRFIEKKAAICHEVWTTGEARLARIFSVVSLGDFVSLYLAYLNEEDPTPVDAIESFKQQLRP